MFAPRALIGVLLLALLGVVHLSSSWRAGGGGHGPNLFSSNGASLLTVSLRADRSMLGSTLAALAGAGGAGGGSPPPTLVAFHVLTTRKGLVRHLLGHSAEWMAELRSVGTLLYSVGRSSDAEDADIVERVRALFPPGVVTITEFDVPDDEYPPISKTMAAFEHLSAVVAPRFQFVYNVDDDTHFHPLRMAALVAQRSPAAPLYMGRPLVNCLCEPGQPKGRACTPDVATSYCAGAGYAFSAATLTAMASRWTSCWADHGGAYRTRCHSSDTFVGMCLNRALGTECSAATVLSGDAPAGVEGLGPAASAAIANYTAAAFAAGRSADAAHTPRWGTSWGHIMASGHSLHLHTLFCQDASHVGGVAQRMHAASPHRLDAPGRALCAYLHPLKVDGVLSIPHIRFARFLLTEGEGEWGGRRHVETPLLTALAALQRAAGGADGGGGGGATPFVGSALTGAVVTSGDAQAPPTAPASRASAVASLVSSTGAAHCRLALSIQTAPAHTELRNVIRSTWLRVAQAMGRDVIRVFFVIGTPAVPLAPHAQVGGTVEGEGDAAWVWVRGLMKSISIITMTLSSRNTIATF